MNYTVKYRGFEIWTELQKQPKDTIPKFLCHAFFRQLPDGRTESFAALPGDCTPGKAHQQAMWMAQGAINRQLVEVGA